MKGINPIIPPGSNFEGPRRGRSNMRMAVVAVVGVHIALCLFILAASPVACKQESKEESVEDDRAQNVPLKAAPLPESNLPTDPLPSLPSGEVEDGFQPMLPPLETASLPLAPEQIPLGGIATPNATSESATSVTEYKIASGDNFWTIGRKFGVSALAIEQVNPSIVPTRLQIGQKINIPSPASITSSVSSVETVASDSNIYIVKSGDTLGHIALKHKVKVGELKTLNALESDLIRIGQKLKLPEKAVAEPLSAPASSSLLPPPLVTPKLDSPNSSSAPNLDPSGLPVGGAGAVLPPLGN